MVRDHTTSDRGLDPHVTAISIMECLDGSARLTLIDLAEYYHAWELCFGIVRDGGSEEEDAYLAVR